MHRLAMVFLVFGCLFLPQAAFAPSAAAESTCPRGQHWVANTSVGAKGNDVYGAFTTHGGSCQPNRPVGGHKGSTGSSKAKERSLINCLLQGISGSEIDGGFLTIEAPRSVSCPDPMAVANSRTIDVSALARSLIVRLRLPDANPRFGPDPNNNEWKMLAVGFPVWLWTDGPRHKETTASAYGITFRLSADLANTTFKTGDGGQVTCAAMTPYSSSVKAGSPSPTCGHVYTKPSLPKGAYSVTATPLWRIRWSAEGFSGTLTTSYSDSSQIRIGELQALNR